MSVYITHAGHLLGIPTEDDYAPNEACGSECHECLQNPAARCPAQTRRFELLADAWMLGGSFADFITLTRTGESSTIES